MLTKVVDQPEGDDGDEAAKAGDGVGEGGGGEGEVYGAGGEGGGAGGGGEGERRKVEGGGGSDGGGDEGGLPYPVVSQLAQEPQPRVAACAGAAVADRCQRRHRQRFLLFPPASMQTDSRKRELV